MTKYEHNLQALVNPTTDASSGWRRFKASHTGQTSGRSLIDSPVGAGFAFERALLQPLQLSSSFVPESDSRQ